MLLHLVIGTLALASGAPEKMWGVTLDDVWNPAPQVAALAAFRKRPTARIVFDGTMEAGDYLPMVKKIQSAAQVMGEPVDSEPANTRMTVDEYRLRMSTFMDKMGRYVDIWEVGNEVNGDWTGASQTVGSKVAAGMQEAKSRGRKAAITLFYDQDFNGTDREMRAWSKKYLTAAVRSSADYVLVSFYPTTATGKHPDWKPIFTDLASIFPNAKLGFGELGLVNPDGSLSTNAKNKKALIQRYYGMSAPIANRFIGGYFWWTFAEDAVPKTKALWATFRDLIK